MPWLSPLHQQQEKNYLFVVELQKYALSELKDGVVAKDLYQKVVDKIQADRPDLLQYFVKTAGFGVRSQFHSLISFFSSLMTLPLARRWVSSSVMVLILSERKELALSRQTWSSLSLSVSTAFPIRKERREQSSYQPRLSHADEILHLIDTLCHSSIRFKLARTDQRFFRRE